MKKTALILCLVILICIFPSCKGESTIVGTWYGEMDLSPLVEEMFKETGSYFDDVKFKGFKLGVIYEFSEDGTYEIKIAEGTKDELNEKLFKKLKPSMLKYLDALSKELGVDYRDTLKEKNITEDDFIRGMILSVNVLRPLGNFEAELYYKTEDGRLYSADTPESLENVKFYINYELSGKKLKFPSNSRDDEGKTPASVDWFWEILKETSFKRV